jgi:hypothetical protein
MGILPRREWIQACAQPTRTLCGVMMHHARARRCRRAGAQYRAAQACRIWALAGFDLTWRERRLSHLGGISAVMRGLTRAWMSIVVRHAASLGRRVLLAGRH